MKALFIFILAVIPVLTLLYFGVENKTAWYFDRPGNDADNSWIGDYKYVVDRYGDHPQYFKAGLMVGHYANIAVVSLVADFIATIVYLGVTKQ